MKNELASDLPLGWQWKKMGEIANVIGGGTPKSKEQKFYEGGSIPWLTPADLSGYLEKYIAKGARNITEEGLNASSARMMPAGTVLFTSRAPIGYVAIAGCQLCTNQGFKSFVLKNKDVLPDYVYWWLRGNKPLAESYASGTTFLELSGAKAKLLPIPLAPLEQQKHIVAKIEELFSHIDSGIESLKKAKQLLKQYRQSVLKAAVTGELTKEWREANKDKLEPASQLLERILNERRQNWEEQQLEQFKAKATTPKGDKWKEKYKEPTVPDSSDLPELPLSWLWSGFEQVSSPEKNAMKAGPFGSALKKSFYVEKGYKIYGQEQVINSDPYLGDYYIDEDKYQSLINCAVKPGDFLISLVGTVGRTLVLPEDIEPGIINPRLIKITFDKSVCLPEFAQIYVASPAAKQLFKLASHGGTMDVLNMGTLKSLPLPLPSLQEQRAIITEVHNKEQLIERLLNYIGQQIKLSERNKQSILSFAFDGKL